MRWRVALDRPRSQTDGRGGVTRDFEEVFRAYAKFRWLRGGETVQAARLAGRQPVVIRLHLTSLSLRITTGWRVRDLAADAASEIGAARIGHYNIRSVVPTEDRRWIEITAESNVSS
ncbi:MAG: head-tail adaptor protein [Rhodobacteraceae bacterium]|nr:head-tail adaptor protein [Paracoccaceae bacterium]MBR9823733.1 head-tail adaptor protein [Paracoccaceae bacterium]